MRNFINEAVMGKPIGQLEFLDDITQWWNDLEPMYQYAIIGGAGLLVIVLLFAMLKPSAMPETVDVKGMEKLLKLKMLKELAE